SETVGRTSAHDLAWALMGLPVLWHSLRYLNKFRLFPTGNICFCCRVYIESCLNIGIEFSCSFTIKMAKPVDPFVLICKVGHSNSKSFSAGLVN
ncbi:hypothetical protein J1N35_015002, partial [Gossypium stocksii]